MLRYIHMQEDGEGKSEYLGLPSMIPAYRSCHSAQRIADKYREEVRRVVREAVTEIAIASRHWEPES